MPRSSTFLSAHGALVTFLLANARLAAASPFSPFSLLESSSDFTSATEASSIPSLTSSVPPETTDRAILADFNPADNSTDPLLILQARQGCANPCGWAGQLCCAVGQQCYTDTNNQAQCGAGQLTAAATANTAAGGYWAYYTSTWVETNYVTKTMVYSSYVAPAPTVQATAPAVQCNYALNQSPCGPICCASGQYCYASGQCMAAAGGSSGYYSSIYTTPAPPARPTSNTLIIVTATASATVTLPYETPVVTGGNMTLTPAESSTSGGGLSGGAIAGIVIGVLLGIALLILLCLFCCVKAGFDLLGGIFGRKKQKRVTTEETYIEAHHSGAAGGGRPPPRRWYGDRPSRPQKEGGRFGGLAGVGAGLAGLAILLGLKRRHDRKEKSSYSGSSYTYSSSDYTSSSSSSGDRTRRSSRR